MVEALLAAPNEREVHTDTRHEWCLASLFWHRRKEARLIITDPRNPPLYAHATQRLLMAFYNLREVIQV